jgi:hypothetical protein
MPLRDHFGLPGGKPASWKGLHSQWPAMIVHQLHTFLPQDFVAEPNVQAGSRISVDVGTFEEMERSPGPDPRAPGGGVATLPWIAAEPSLAVETGLPVEDEFEVLVYDVRDGRQLIAAIEIISPANKDRPESRNMFVAKCVALLRKGVAVSLVDLVTTRRPNLYVELLSYIGQSDPKMLPAPPPIYAASCRWIEREERTILETWSHTLAIGQPLPTLPLWLTESVAVPLDLESSYEQACRDLRIP